MDGPSQIAEWRKISDLGAGAFGVVSLWRHNTSDDYIAIKKCKFQTHASLTEKQKERWNNEVEIMKIINHPNIVTYKCIPHELEAGILKHNPSKLPLLPMEYCCKGNLRHMLTKPKNISGMQEQDIRLILEDVSKGLQHLHKLKITHRDIKPDNIVLQHCENRKGNTIYKIIDLGYAKDINDTVVSFVGTLHYLAPEIFETEQYNNSVDYWSMGIMTFEIICGVLPFLPHLPPFERFEKIKQKAADVICIYLSYSGHETNSSEIKKENYISSCLTQNIETWLRHVLQYSPSKRLKDFPDNIKVFDNLQNILNKRIVTVFSGHKLEFYSYEINESTLLTTLKDWISRDTKIPNNDLILLFNNEVMKYEHSKTLVIDILENDSKVYVFKKGALVNDSVTYNFPKLLKELFRSAIKFDMKYMKQLYAQTVYYVTTEKDIIETFKKSFELFLIYLQQFIGYLKFINVNTSKHLSKLLIKIECYNSIRTNDVCEIDLCDNQQYKDCLIYSRRLLDSLERGIINFKEFQKKKGIISKRQKILMSFLPEMQELIKNCNVEEQYTKAVTLIERTTKNKECTGKIFTSEIKDIITETIKIKDRLLFNKKFKSYLSAMGNVYNSIETLHSWIIEFEKHIFELSKSFEQSERALQNIIINAVRNIHKNAKKTNSADSLNGDLLKLPISYLIQENHNLRHQFEEILSKSILAHKNYAESVRDYLS